MDSLEIIKWSWPILDRVFCSSPSSKAALNQELILNGTTCTTKFLTQTLLKSFCLSTKWLVIVWWVIKHSSFYQILKPYTYLIWINVNFRMCRVSCTHLWKLQDSPIWIWKRLQSERLFIIIGGRLRKLEMDWGLLHNHKICKLELKLYLSSICNF